MQVDDQEPRALQSRHRTLSQRCDRRREGDHCPPDSASPARRAQAERQYSRSVQWGAVSVEHRVSVASDSQGFAAVQYALL
jgi:hypothetical protein